MVKIEEPLSTFVHIPKTGGKSIHHWMTFLEGFNNVTNRNLHKLCKRSGNKGHPTRNVIENKDKKFGDLGTVFTCVRNPWDRFVSGYFFMIQGGVLNNKMSFHEFVNNTKIWNFMTVKQVEFVRDDDIVMKLENIDEDFKLMQDFYNDHRPLGTRNVTTGRKEQSYHKIFDEKQDLIDIIGNYYQEDVEKFNYSYDNT